MNTAHHPIHNSGTFIPLIRTAHRLNGREHHLPVGQLFAMCLLTLALSACDYKAGNKATPQVAAEVGSVKISVDQINFLLNGTNTANDTQESTNRLRQEVLEKLIDQQLAVGQAVEKKLDRTPEVISRLEAARREVLARAYVQQFLAALPKPTADEIKKYFQNNPALFSERRIYNLQEIVVPNATGTDALEPIKEQVAASQSMEELVIWLKAHNVIFGGNSATRAAEQIPLELLKTVAAMKDGQATVIANPQGFTILRVVSSQSAPVQEAAALPRIEQFLANQRGAEAVSKAIKDLRSKTTITYMAEFAPRATGTAMTEQSAASTAPVAESAAPPLKVPKTKPSR